MSRGHLAIAARHRKAHGPMGRVPLHMIQSDLARLRVYLSILAAKVEKGRADGFDMADGAANLAELVVTIGRMSAEIDIMSSEGP